MSPYGLLMILIFLLTDRLRSLWFWLFDTQFKIFLSCFRYRFLVLNLTSQRLLVMFISRYYPQRLR